MCNFCMLFDFTKARARVENGNAWLEKAPTGIPFLPSQGFKFCPMCGTPVNPALTPSKNFAQNLRKIRRMRGLTQTDLGSQLNLQKSAICKYEKGRTLPNAKQLAKICEILDVSPQELI